LYGTALVIPIVTPEEMRAIDAAAPEPVDVLIGRAGAAVARTARHMLGGTYGRRVTVIAGKGNNGNDGRAAAELLRSRGTRVEVLDAVDGHRRVARCDLVIDAAYGTGFRGSWEPPDVGATPVLAVDIPSGVDGLSGAADGAVLPAAETVTFAALKPGLLLAPGRGLAGEVTVADIGLPTPSRSHLVEAGDAATWLPARPVDANKWKAAIWIVAGSAGMLGAAHLASRAAQRTGAGMVRLSSPGAGADPLQPTEAVGVPVTSDGFASTILGQLDRFHALVVGPGLGRAEATIAGVRELVAGAALPVVVDGDGLFAVHGHLDVLSRRSAPTVVTPHDGEYAGLTGAPPGPDRFAAARKLAAALGAVVLLKGPATIVADTTGRVLVVCAGDQRLATAGTGDVLSGTIGALLAQGVAPLEAAALGAWIHGAAGMLGPARGLVAGDLPDRIPDVLASL
jgi:NAD(P)H-hydrate epimerase